MIKQNCLLFLTCINLVLSSKFIPLDHAPGKPVYVQPEQIHLSLGVDETEMMVTWTTFNETDESLVKYGIDSLDMLTQGSATLFTDEGDEKRQMYIHRVVMKGLIPGHKYEYHCGSHKGWSPLFFFTALKSGIDWSPKFAVYGDLGNLYAESLGPLQEDAQLGVYDAFFHVGDFAYDMHDDNGRIGDEFMRQIEPIAAYVPYQTCPGNHEQYYNFSHYDNRFSMMSQDSDHINNHYWSYDIGPAHVIAFSTEFYHYKQYGSDQIKYQYQWLEKDLIEANKKDNREKHPWIITFGHRPLYGYDGIDDNLRLGDNVTETERVYGLEDLFYKHGVDVEVWAHEHWYHRLWPIYNNTLYKGSEDEPYKNPKAPVHIITGSPGSYMQQTICHTCPDHYYTAYNNSDWSYTVMTVINTTHLNIKQISVDKNLEPIDEIMVIKDTHESYA